MAIFHRRRLFVLAVARRRSYSGKMARRLGGDPAGRRMRDNSVSGPFDFFLRRWRRQVPLGLLFWRDMVVVGTAINLAAVLAGLIALAMKVELAIALLIIHAPLPYNIFLVASVWRSADMAEPKKAGSVRTAAVLWLVISTLI